jgi:restriction system protein
MARSAERDAAKAYSLVWIGVFTILAGLFWPRGAGLVCICLAFVGVLHLAVLAHERINGPQFRESMSPQEFEHYCADVLRQARWEARVTPASGDQGVDIIADKRGLRVVVQCKKYSKPVGNRAVQEIVAAIAHEEADRGVVVATCGFTPAAERLARSNDVLLLHHSDLHRIEKLLRGRATAGPRRAGA